MSRRTRDDHVCLAHIRECLTRITQYTEGGRQEFSSDTKTQDAVLRNLQTLAESTQKLSQPLKAAHSQISWRQIAAFRSVLAHDYLGIHLERVRETIVQDLPPLEQHVVAMLATEASDAG